MSDDNGERMVAAAQPLERAMFLFNPPPGMSSAEMRKKASAVFAASVVIVSIVFAITPTLMQMSGPISQLHDLRADHEAVSGARRGSCGS